MGNVAEQPDVGELNENNYHQFILKFIEEYRKDFIFLYDDTNMYYGNVKWKASKISWGEQQRDKQLFFHAYFPFISTLGHGTLDEYYIKRTNNEIKQFLSEKLKPKLKEPNHTIASVTHKNVEKEITYEDLESYLE